MFKKVKTKIFALVAIASAATIHAQTPAPAPVAQTRLIEKMDARPDGLIIPYEKWKLPNGLTVIIHEDHSDPIVSVSVTYKVGSNRESLGKSGFAHLFEHMMFQGSSHVKDEEHFKIVSEAGGDMNGNTTEDRTFYYEVLPSNQLETALWLESDRMGFLLDSLTSKKFENQRDAVKNEKGQNVENQPYGMAFSELLQQTLYPLKHPYNWPVIGFTDDLNRASLQDVKNFFLRWYGPNNAILTVAGDVDPKEVLKLTEKYFGAIKPGPEVKKMKAPLPVLPNDKYASYKDNIYLPLTLRVYPSVPAYHRDEPALDMLADMMGGGNNSLFYKNFVKSKKAIQANVYHGIKELAGEFTMMVFAYPPEDMNYEKLFNELDAKLKETMTEFEKTGITDEALQRAKTKMESRFISSGESVLGKASMISEWDRLVGRPFNLSDEIDRYNRVTKEDVVKVFNKYLKGTGAAIVNVYPKLDPKKDSVKSFNPYAGMKFPDDPEYNGLTYIKPVDNFDRSVRPAVGAPRTPSLPDYYTSQLKNGLKIVGTKTSETPTVQILLEIEGGDIVLPSEEYKKNGIAELTASLMNESTKNYTTEQVSAELEKLGSNILFFGSKSSAFVSVSCMKKNLDATLKILEEKLMRPGFDAEDFKRVKKQYKESLRDEKTSPNALASKAFNSILYGENSMWGSSPSPKNVDKLELEDVKTYYNKYYSPSVATVIVVGDVAEKEILPRLEFLNNWAAREVKMPVITTAPPPSEPTIYLVEKSFAPQSVILMGQLSNTYDATGDYFKNTVANYPFGGAFNSRLNLNLREDKGYTYGISSYFSGDKRTGLFGIRTSVKRASTADALKEILKDINTYLVNGPTDEEVNFTKNSLLNNDVLNYETARDKAGFLSRITKYNLPKDYKSQQAQVLKGMAKADFTQQAKKSIDMNKMAIVIVGDADIIKDEIEKLNASAKTAEDKITFKTKNYSLD